MLPVWSFVRRSAIRRVTYSLLSRLINPIRISHIVVFLIAYIQKDLYHRLPVAKTWRDAYVLLSK